MKPKQIGEISEAKIIARLLELEIPVSKPFGDNQPYDLIIEQNGKLLKIQCKTGRLKNKSITCKLTKARINTKSQYVTNYIGLVDAFIIYCPENNECYYFEYTDQTNLNLYIPYDSLSDILKAKSLEAKKYIL